MGRQYRAPRRGELKKAVPPAVLSTALSAIVTIPNYGFTDIGGGSTAGSYVLDAPEEGVVKVLACVTSTSGARVVRMSTANTVSVGTLAGTTGTGGGHQITFNATVDMVVTLWGVNSTHWAIQSMYPPTAANSTGIVVAST
jgi:hypothetical protein